MNAIDVVQQIVDITVDSGAETSVWPIRRKGVARTKEMKKVRLGGSERQSETCRRRREIGICSGRQELQNEVLGR